MACFLAAFVLAAAPIGAPCSVEAQPTAAEMVAARDDRAEAVRDGVFTDRVIIRCTTRTSCEELAAVSKDPTSAFGAIADRWKVRFVLPTFSPAPKDEAIARRLGMDRMVTLFVPDGTDVRMMAAELARLSDLVELAEIDLCAQTHSGPGDPLFSQQWGLNNTGQSINGVPGTAGADIHAQAAWDICTHSNPIVVAILDTGVSQSHPDLMGIQVPGQNTVTPSTPNNWDDNTSQSHGTYCAGIAGARASNGIGIVGVAPNVRIMPVKVLNPLGSQTSCANGLTWAADNGARIASMSLGWGTSASTLVTAIAYASSRNVLMCASTGNAPGSPIAFPANSVSVIAVGGSNSADGGYTGGTTGVQMDLVGPAADVLCTSDDGSGIDGYSFQSGTSMATPIIAGVAAMVLGEAPNLTADQVWDILQSTADDLGNVGWDPIFGYGRVNARAAVEAAHRLTCPIDIDANGRVDVYDIFTYVGYFFSSNALADFNHSGHLEISDMFEFLSAYLAGGC